MQLSDYINTAELEKAIEDGYVEVRYHGVLPLALYCYSRKATYDNHWTDVTTRTRGLIVDAQGTIVARPFEKFFNLDTVDRPETHISNLPIHSNQQPIVMEKLDGSLGTIWRYGSFTGVASKGSFQSEHAKWASAWYEKHSPNPQWPEGYTPQVEMICQSVQRHVVSYDIPDQLILTGLINNETGEELPYNDLYHYAFLNGMKVAEIFSKSVGDVVNEDRPNKEGYVLTYPRPGTTPLKLKVKHESFLKLQKLVHGISVRSIFESISEGRRDILQTWVDQSPAELATLIHYWVGFFMGKYGETLVGVRNLYTNIMAKSGDRPTFAGFAKNTEFPQLLFGVLDEKDIRPMVWEFLSKKYKVELSKPLVHTDPEDDEDDR